MARALADGQTPTRAGAGENAFDALRLFAALLVLFHHSFGLTNSPSLFGERADPGELALLMFFAMSGFMVTASWERAPRVWTFAQKRLLRLMPALIVVTLLTALVLGPLVTKLPVADYFTSSQTYSYVGWNSLLLTWHQDLPGVFTTLGVQQGTAVYHVNGSLWTLPVEAGAYCAVAAAGWAAGRLRAWHALAAIVSGTALVAPGVNIGARLGVPVTSDTFAEWIELYVAFALGSLLWLQRERVPLRAVLLTPGLLLLAVFPVTSGWHRAASGLAVPYLVIFAGFALPRAVRGLSQRIGDPSYGVYITAYPIQQTVAQVWGDGIRPGVMLAISAPFSLLAAHLLWRHVESPALARKPRPGVEADGLVASRAHPAPSEG